ncbi:MAG: hypothetical protein M3Q03_12800 [Chloroflexota bacterium]|nr:hypothetical protein [Chloroflexota bacterium]
MMTERRLDSMQQAADHLLDTLVQGKEVTLEITARDEETGGFLRLITEIHEAAQARQVGVTMTPVGERGLRLTLAEPSQTCTEGRSTTRRG